MKQIKARQLVLPIAGLIRSILASARQEKSFDNCLAHAIKEFVQILFAKRFTTDAELLSKAIYHVTAEGILAV
jgi:hypothetical protein